MKKIILFCLLCCMPSITGMNHKPRAGVVKPKLRFQEKREIEYWRSKRIISILNVSLYYAGLAREELQESLDSNSKLITQAAMVEQSIAQGIQLAQMENQGILRNHIERIHGNIVDTHCHVVFATKPQEQILSVD